MELFLINREGKEAHNEYYGKLWFGMNIASNKAKVGSTESCGTPLLEPRRRENGDDLPHCCTRTTWKKNCDIAVLVSYVLWIGENILQKRMKVPGALDYLP